MADHGKNLEFGVSIVPLAEPPEFALRTTRAAEEAGLDLVGIQDHPYQRRFLDAWTLIATLVPATERVHFYLAKTAASLDVISGGRVEMGLGGGAYWAFFGTEKGELNGSGRFAPRHRAVIGEASGNVALCTDMQSSRARMEET